jgi:Hedgehog amino-terminal signalling domain
MNSAIGAAFGGLVAVILLLLFSASTFYMVSSVISFCASTNPCVSPPAGLVGEGFVYVVTTVAGLVSALVIAQLSITEPGKPPTLGSFRPEGRAATMVAGVVALYLLAWIATGLAALVVGVMLYPKVNQTLADIGSTWLGLAVSAAYAYFGLTPKQAESEARPEAPLEARSEAVPAFLASAANELSLGQKVPNASEVATSGPIARKIKRTDPEFASLVKNLNPKIVFKDEEGTGADRMMTQRLSDRLDRLANLVASEWSDEKLRVTEAWDENNEHAGSSLHYEGRAADLTTSTRDGAKLGRLGKLAVDAGCDWVFFENSAHVHVSVKKV